MPASEDEPEPGRWVPVGETVEIQGFRIATGLFYVNPGVPLGPRTYGQEPSLVFAGLPAKEQDCQPLLKVPYWPSYREVDADARGSYLAWLRDGRRAHHTPISLVFVFLYGLERRTLMAAELGKDRQAIHAEVARLLEVYGGKSVSFRDHATSLLAWLALDGVDAHDLDRLRRINEVHHGSEVAGHSIRIALGFCASSDIPLSPWLALAWAQQSRVVPRSVWIDRQPDRYAVLFKDELRRAYPLGFRIKASSTPLSIAYQPASRVLMNQIHLHPACRGLTDLTATNAQARQLADVSKAAFARLRKESKSRPARPRLPPAAHAAAESLAAPSSPRLDHARVAALRVESEQVNAMLVDVFADAPAAIAPSPPNDGLAKQRPAARLPGLDETATAFLVMLLRQPTWTRDAAEALASDMAVMLDGVLEQVNEASFEHFDAPLLDGDDPIVVDQDLAATLMDAT